MTPRQSDPSPHKRYHVMRDEPGAEVLASFDTIEEAKTHVGAMRHDWRCVIREYGRKIVWLQKRRTPT
jgi:hypothetical protein